MRISFHKWESPAPALRVAAGLGDDEVQVWLGAVPAAEAGMMIHARLLDPEEMSRAERFVAKEPRREFVFGRGVLRQLLGACLNVDPAGLAIGYAERGKPRLEGRSAVSGLRFNLSHSHSLVAIALARGREVGVDIEWMDRSVDWPLIAGRGFSPDELGELRGLPEAQQRVAFFNGWTRKEAYLKATGEGLIDEISAIEVTLAPGKPAGLVRLPGGTGGSHLWGICDIPMPPDFAGALVFEQVGP